MRNGIAVGIGLFIAFIGMKNATLILADTSTGVKLNVHFASPDIVLFLIGLFVTAGLSARHVRGAIVISIVFVTLLAMAFKFALPYLPEAIIGISHRHRLPPGDAFRADGPNRRPPPFTANRRSSRWTW